MDQVFGQQIVLVCYRWVNSDGYRLAFPLQRTLKSYRKLVWPGAEKHSDDDRNKRQCLRVAFRFPIAQTCDYAQVRSNIDVYLIGEAIILVRGIQLDAPTVDYGISGRFAGVIYFLIWAIDPKRQRKLLTSRLRQSGESSNVGRTDFLWTVETSKRQGLLAGCCVIIVDTITLLCILDRVGLTCSSIW